MVASENTPAVKKRFKVDRKKDAGTSSVNVIRVLTCLEQCLKSVTESVFNKSSGLYYKSQ